MRQSRQQPSNRNSFNLKFFDLQIDSNKLQAIINENISEGRYSQTINNTFKFLSLLKKYKSTNDVQTEQIIKSAFENKLMDSRLATISAVPLQIINPSKPYPMIKVGNRTSQEVERECKFTKDGIVQSKDNKMLNIKSVIQIQKKGEGKPSDISWIKDHQKYPYRVVMKDSNNLLRAVFSQTFEEAKQIQDYCIIHLSKANEQFSLLIKKGAKKYKDQVTNTVAERISIKNRLNESRKNVRSSNRMSQQERVEKESNDSVVKNRRKNQVLKMYMQKNNDKSILSQMVRDWEYLTLDENNQIQKPEQLLVPPTNTKSFPPTPRSIVEPIIQIGGSRLEKTGDFIENFTLTFERIQLLKESDVLRKPVLDIKINKGTHNVLYQQTFETILEKQNPHLIYLLFAQNQSLREIDLEQQLNKLEILIIVRDRLLPTINTHSLKLRVKQRINQLLYLASNDGSMRLQVRYHTDDIMPIDQSKQKLINQDGLVLICKQLDDVDIDKIKKKYWNIENKNEYYSSNTTFDVTEILGRLQVLPKFWWFGVTEEQYQILSLIQAASQTLSFIMIQSHLYIIRSLMKIFQNSDKMVQRVFKSFLSIILYYLKPYFSKFQLQKIQNLHIMIGIDINCDLPLKMSLQLNAMNKILNLEIPDLMEKYKHKNVHLGLICYEYLFEIYSRNFNIRLLTSLWNYMFKFPESVQENLLLLSIVLIKINSEALLKVYRYPEIIHVLTEENKKYTDFNHIVSLLQSLKKKYFTKSDSVLQTFKTKLLQQNPFDTVINSFYKRQNVKLDNNAKNKIIQKKKQLSQLVSKYQFTLPKYDTKTHNLHIYFHKLPNIQPFFLELKIKNVQHQCTKIRADTYYIVRKVNSPVQIILTYAGKKWSAVAELIQGIHYAALTLTEQKNSESVFVIQYTGGFLTESQEVAILRGKPSEHYMGSYMKFENIVGECLREIGDCYFLETLPKGKIPYEITQNIKVLFTSGSNRFNDIDFYLSWILELKISPLEKLEKLKLYAETIWTQLFHCSFFQLYKILFRQFLDKMNFPIEDQQFEFLYNGSLDEFDCPRIISLKFVNHDKKKVRLDKYIQKLVSEKSSRYLLSDIIINHKNLFSIVLHHLLREKMTNIDGVLILKYASYGQVKKRIIPLKHQKSNNQLIINTQHQAFVAGTYKIKDINPQLLGTQNYPSFSRITNRLYNQDTQISALKSKYFQGEGDDLEKKKSSQTLNVIGCLYDRLKCTLPLRYRMQCFITHLPFLSYYSQLMYQIVYPPLPRLFFKAVQVPPIKICTFNGGLQLSDNNRNQNQPVNKRLGLHGNISKWNFQTRVIYFWPSKKEESFKTLYPVFVNYGEGVFRTQQCIVHGYCRSLKNKNKIFFIIELQGKNILIPREELLVDNIDIFAEIDLNSEKLSRFKKIIKEYEGKTQEEKDSEVSESMKFTNVIKKEGDFSDTKGMKYYMKTFNQIT